LKRDAGGNVIGEEPKSTHKNRWMVEKREFFDERARMAQVLRDESITPAQGAQQRPQLVGTYATLKLAEGEQRDRRSAARAERSRSRAGPGAGPTGRRETPRSRPCAARVPPELACLVLREAPHGKWRAEDDLGALGLRRPSRSHALSLMITELRSMS
jgi:hypothetical protein